MNSLIKEIKQLRINGSKVNARFSRENAEKNYNKIIKFKEYIALYEKIIKS